MTSTMQWQVTEFQVTSNQAMYENPYFDVDVTATFIGPNGETVARPAYWLGDAVWGVRFAPISVGVWTYTMSCNDPHNNDFNHIAGSITCIPYTGNLEIYRKGFLKTISGKRFLYYNDGTPFFWLGDTHWNVFCLEKLHESNKPGFESQFKGMVDLRVDQRFTVYQTNLIGD
ncbi:MAG: DUF5060 domain-containing protein, partial [Oscillospiraceae bacterium]|nr:DUF5060 domain-containing protein [Oscillospiraceae bacterium]